MHTQGEHANRDSNQERCYSDGAYHHTTVQLLELKQYKLIHEFSLFSCLFHSFKNNFPSFHRGLADTKQTGKLTREQFSLAMHLIQQKVTKGIDPPSALTPDMIPPSERSTTSVTGLVSPDFTFQQPFSLKFFLSCKVKCVTVLHTLGLIVCYYMHYKLCFLAFSLYSFVQNSSCLFFFGLLSYLTELFGASLLCET